jgi:hypothetical protein
MLCRHCHRSPVTRPRGLCRTCYYRSGVRDRFPSTSKFARQGFGLASRTPGLPSAPTIALPGTPQKVAVLEERARLHQSLWHPLDR